MIRKWTPWRLPRCPIKPTPRASVKPLHQWSALRTSPKRAIAAQKKRVYQPPTLLGKRSLFTESLPPILIPPAIFIGLLVALWTWKCFWIVVLQDKLLYLSWLPPLSRSESIADYAREFRGVEWTEKRIRSLDGTALAVCEGRFPERVRPGRSGEAGLRDGLRKRVVICYFQGNGGSTPLRLPLLSQVMKAIQETSGSAGEDPEFILVALSYRGYWKSSGRATQSGIEQDAQAFLSWVSENYVQPDRDVSLVLWGHSLGAAVASSAVVKNLAHPAENQHLSIAGLILEAPISSIKDMLISLYPQKWLPYRYLWPFSWNNWDVSSSLEQMTRYKTAAPSETDSSKRISVPPIFLMSAESDEVIPLWVADQLEEKAKASGLDIERKSVKGAMHIEGPLKLDGRTALVDFIIKSSAGQDKYPNPTSKVLI